MDKFSGLKEFSESNLKELKHLLTRLSFKFEKTRLYFDNSIFPRDFSLRVMDVDSNMFYKVSE